MKKVLFLALMITAFTMFVNQPVLVHAGGVKVKVCHIPPSDPTNFHTLKVSEKAASAHLGHGDFLGSCDTPAEIRCDDGNACTQDSYLPGTVTCDNSQPVQCGGDLCSNTTCDPVDGCVDAPTLCDYSDPCVAANICDPNDGLCNSTPTTCPVGETCDPGVGCVPDFISSFEGGPPPGNWTEFQVKWDSDFGPIGSYPASCTTYGPAGGWYKRQRGPEEFDRVDSLICDGTAYVWVMQSTDTILPHTWCNSANYGDPGCDINTQATFSSSSPGISNEDGLVLCLDSLRALAAEDGITCPF